MCNFTGIRVTEVYSAQRQNKQHLSCDNQLQLQYYLGDMLSVDGGADAAVEARIRIGWNKFRQLVPLLTNRDISLIRRGRLYSSCVK